MTALAVPADVVTVDQLLAVLGWPAPDTPPEDVLRFAGTPGVPVGRVLATERARPPHLQRAQLILQLEARAAQLGANATSLSPIDLPADDGGGLLR